MAYQKTRNTRKPTHDEAQALAGQLAGVWESERIYQRVLATMDEFAPTQRLRIYEMALKEQARRANSACANGKDA